MSTLKLSLVQCALVWEKPDDNRSHIQHLLDTSSIDSDIIILPEMFTTGFSMSAKALAEPFEGPTLKWMKEMADKFQSAICGSVIISENGMYFNRFIWVQPDGKIHYYDKRHLFTLAEEEKFYTPGQEKIVFDFKSWKICPLICYDLRFPVWSRNTEGYDLLIYVANWPSPRAHAWRNLLKSRAIENQCYTIGVNRVGKDDNGLEYLGDSAVIDYNGGVMGENRGDETIIQVEIHKQELHSFREKLNFLADRDSFQITK